MAIKKVDYDGEMKKWKGKCPRCGNGGFFEPLVQTNYANLSVDVVACYNGHPICIEFPSSRGRGLDNTCYPVEWKDSVPEWLPPEYHTIYEELIKAKSNNMPNSVIALCGILLDAHVNTLLNKSSDKGMSLFKRLEQLIESGTIESSEFSEATIARVGRKKAVHPKDLMSPIEPSEVDEIFRATNDYLESRFRFRASKALPAGKDKPEDTEEVTAENTK